MTMSKKHRKVKNVVVKCAADMFLPFSTTFGLCVILFGSMSPGGGFQGGVIVAAACLLLYLGYGYKTASKAINMEVLGTNEAVGAILYVILALCGIFLGVRFCQNVFFEGGQIGEMLSGGTITYMSYAVGYKVLTGVGFLLLLLLGLLAPDGDSEEETEGADK